MRITLPVAGDILASGRWNARFPHIKFDNDILNEKGMIRVDVVAKRLAEYGKIFRDGSADTYNTYSMTVEFVRRLIHTTEMLEACDTNDAHLADDGSPEDRRLIRRMEKEQTANVIIDIREREDGVVFDVRQSNPNTVVIGQADVAARDFAIYCLRCIYTIAEDAKRRYGNRLLVHMKSRDDTLIGEALRDEMHGRACDRVRWYNSRRHKCKCCAAGLCSPFHPRCRFYTDGRCEDLKFPNREDYKIIITKEYHV